MTFYMYFLCRPNNFNHKEISNQQNYKNTMTKYSSGRDKNFELLQGMSVIFRGVFHDKT